MGNQNGRYAYNVRFLNFELIMKQFNLEEYYKNPSRKIVTRDGRNVRIICTDRRGDYPVIALIEKRDTDEETLDAFTERGCWDLVGKESIHDLFFVPEKKEGWVNIYRNIYMGTHAGPIFHSKEDAERRVREDSLKEKTLSSYLTTVKIEWEE